MGIMAEHRGRRCGLVRLRRDRSGLALATDSDVSRGAGGAAELDTLRRGTHRRPMEFASYWMPIGEVRGIRRRRKVAVYWLPDFVYGRAEFIFLI